MSLVGALMSVGPVACGGSEPVQSAAASGGVESRGGNMDTGGTTGSGARPGATGGMASGGRAPREPAGTSVVTFVHGIVDANDILVCFAAGSGDERRYLGDPAPKGGLSYGMTWVLPEQVVAAESETLQPVVLTGELELVAGLDCERAVARALEEQRTADEVKGEGGAGAQAGAGGSDGGQRGSGDAGATGHALPSGGAAAEGAGGAGAGQANVLELVLEGGAGGAGGAEGVTGASTPRLRVAALPAVPREEADSGQSQLFVATGCMGSPAYAGPLAERACGDAYTPRNPTVSGVWVTLSRAASPVRLGLQVVHASRANGTVQVWLASDDPSKPWLRAAHAASYGTIEPRPANTSYSAAEYGIEDASYHLQVQQDSAVLFEDTWEDVLTRVDAERPLNGQNYTLVLIGPDFTLRSRGFWNPPRVTWVVNDPGL
ncbi:MAG TPA: hypothetical protein VFQ61_33745 [Polyangiaceae bacterium]|nr:hypothetical protein [Polyangiaceae bacterium]